jgi:hypothetical protein
MRAEVLVVDTSTNASASPVSILVIEHASYSLPWLEREASGQTSLAGQLPADLVVVSQLASETPAAFATRVVRRIIKAGPRQIVTRAVLACGPRSDEAVLMARAQIAQSLLAAAQRGPDAKLTLAAAPGADDRLRRQLLAIAGTMLEQAATPRVSISVQLGERGSPRKGALSEGDEIIRQVA